VDPSGRLLPCELLASLISIEPLALCNCKLVDVPDLEQLCASMPQPRSLNGNIDVGAGPTVLPSTQPGGVGLGGRG
jgi:hypothetical protein